MLTPDELTRLTQIEQRANKADPGPWRHTLVDDMRVVVSRNHHYIVAGDGARDDPQAYIDRFEFIAACRQDVPWLVALVKTLAGTRRPKVNADPDSMDDHLLLGS